jgi:16S rRNA processing protein RimM
LNGAVRVELTLEDDRLFETGRRVKLIGRGDRETEVEFFRRQHGNCVVKFRGIDHISEAERLVGAEIKVAADQLHPLEEGWFYTFQLKGCRVFTAGGECLGTITDVLDFGGAEVLKVDSENEETLIPFAQEYLRRIDLDQQRIDVDLPEGLRGLNK